MDPNTLRIVQAVERILYHGGTIIGTTDYPDGEDLGIIVKMKTRAGMERLATRLGHDTGMRVQTRTLRDKTITVYLED